jgi:hypothetical protein
MIAEIKVSATSPAEIAASLRSLAEDFDRLSDQVSHWGGHHGKPGSYYVTITDRDKVQDDL